MTATGLLAVLSTFAGAARADEDAGLDPDYSLLTSVLDEICRGESNAWGRGRDRLSGIGPALAPKIFAVLAGRVELQAPVVEGEAGHPLLDGRTESFLREVLASYPAESVAHSLNALLDDEAPLDQRWVAIRVLGDCGNRRCMEEFLGMLSPVDEIQLGRPYVRATIEEALSAILLRDPGAHAPLRESLSSLPAKLLPSVIAALGRSGRSPSFQILLDLLTRGVRPPGEILAQLCRPDVRDYDTLFEDCSRAARTHLESADSSADLHAVEVLGKLRDPEVVGQLVRRIDPENPAANRVILQALREITGIDFGADVGAWSAWLEGEERWLLTEGVEVRKQLERLQATETLAALRKVSDHPFHRRILHASVSELLFHPNEAVVRAACSALEQLDDPGALPGLVESLRDERPAVREAAHAALLSISGMRLPQDAEVWSTWLLH